MIIAELVLIMAMSDVTLKHVIASEAPGGNYVVFGHVNN